MLTDSLVVLGRSLILYSISICIYSVCGLLECSFPRMHLLLFVCGSTLYFASFDFPSTSCGLSFLGLASFSLVLPSSFLCSGFAPATHAWEFPSRFIEDEVPIGPSIFVLATTKQSDQSQGVQVCPSNGHNACYLEK
jgi:hypothetical protein